MASGDECNENLIYKEKDFFFSELFKFDVLSSLWLYDVEFLGVGFEVLICSHDFAFVFVWFKKAQITFKEYVKTVNRSYFNVILTIRHLQYVLEI